MFVLNSNITIGQYKNVKPHEVKITKSVHSFVDKCIIKVPISARIVNTGTICSESADTAKLFEHGDAVYVELGYNGKLRKEFKGFVSRVNFTSPVEIECEGYSYQLRQQTYEGYYKSAPLKTILEYLITGTDIKLHPDNPDVPIVGFKINKGTNGVDVLESLKKHLEHFIYFIFTDNILYAGIKLLDRKTDVKYKLGWNVIKDNNLKLHIAKDVEVIINGVKKDGTKSYVAVGSHVKKISGKHITKVSTGSGMQKVFTTHNITDKSVMAQMAKEYHNRENYDGYEGKITCFLQPYCEPCYRANIEDVKYQERSGKYNVEATEVTYGTSGARRVVKIGLRLTT